MDSSVCIEGDDAVRDMLGGKVLYVFSGVGNSEALHIAVVTWGVVGMTRGE
jgi:hypothetical protein